MAEDYNAISDGTYVLVETNVENQFLFYREDHGVLTDIDEEPMDFFHSYLAQKMFSGKIPATTFMGNICMEKSDDEKSIRLTVKPIGNLPFSIDVTPKAIPKKSNFLKRLLNKIFG